MALTLDIVTPVSRTAQVTCDEVRLPGSEGGLGIRPGHTPLVVALAKGELVYVTGGAEHRMSIGEGFAEVAEDKVRVLVEQAANADGAAAGAKAAAH